MSRFLFCVFSTACLSSTALAGPHRVANILGDVNGDCSVDTTDLMVALGAVGSGQWSADVNHDGAIDDRDIDIISALMGSNCSDRLIGDADGDGIVTTRDLRFVLEGVGTEDVARDISGDGVVDEVDLAYVRANMGMVVGQRVLGDVNGSGEVNVVDLLITLDNFGPGMSLADLDGDGLVSGADVHIVRSQFGETCSTALAGDISFDGQVDDTDVELLEVALGTDWARADLDGDGMVTTSDLLDLLTTHGLTTGTALVGDINGDGAIGRADVALLKAAWGSQDIRADLDGDGEVGIEDLLILLANVG
jgi:hypothetical protein